MEKISAVYKIVNTVTGDFYIGSSRNVKNRWACHTSSYRWKQSPNNPMYQDMQKYGVDKFIFQILAPVMPEYLKQVEQEFIEMLQPTYNNNRAKGWDVEKRKESNRRYNQSDKRKEANRKYSQTEKRKRWCKNYYNQLCLYKGETLTLDTLRCRFRKAGIEHPTAEARKYLLNQ